MDAMEEVAEFLRKAGVFYLATVEGDQPRVRPFGVVNIFEGQLYLQTGRKKDVYRQLLANPKAEICAVKGGTWVRIATTLKEDARVEAEAAMLDANPSLKRLYAAGDGNTVVFALTNATATFSSFTTGPRTVTF